MFNSTKNSKVLNSYVNPIPPNSFGCGLTKRELFAAMALQGLLAGNTVAHEPEAFAVSIADELIRQLDKEFGNEN